MKEINKFINLATKAVRKGFLKLKNNKNYGYKIDKDYRKEFKAKVDREVENIILKDLFKSNLNILTEENGLISVNGDSSLKWVLDPLDGTHNYLKLNGLGPCSISLGLYRNDNPLWGIICEYPSGKIATGGPGIASHYDGAPIRVSNIRNKKNAVICTGFPARYKFNKIDNDALFKTYSTYNKIRMLGCASISLLCVARGLAEAYSEKEIMIWDVGGGLPIVLGAGGKVNLKKSNLLNSYTVFASNGHIKNE